MDVRGALHVGQQIGLPSRVGRQIGVEWVVAIGDGMRGKSVDGGGGCLWWYAFVVLAILLL